MIHIPFSLSPKVSSHLFQISTILIFMVRFYSSALYCLHTHTYNIIWFPCFLLFFAQFPCAVATVRYVLQVHPCGRYRHNTVVFILAKEYNLKNLRTIHRLDRLTSGLLLFGRSPKKARQMEHQIRNRQVQKEYVCRVEGEFPE